MLFDWVRRDEVSRKDLRKLVKIELKYFYNTYAFNPIFVAHWMILGMGRDRCEKWSNYLSTPSIIKGRFKAGNNMRLEKKSWFHNIYLFQVTVTNIIDQYISHINTTSNPTSAPTSASSIPTDNTLKTSLAVEVIRGFGDYFNVSLGSQLLYSFERYQYKQVNCSN